MPGSLHLRVTFPFKPDQWWSEARRKDLVRELEALATIDHAISLDDARLKREIKVRLADTKALLGRHVAGARRLLRTLLEQPLRCEAVREGNQKCYRITGTGSYLPLLPEQLTPLQNPGVPCSVVLGVPPYSQLEPSFRLALRDEGTAKN